MLNRQRITLKEIENRKGIQKHTDIDKFLYTYICTILIVLSQVLQKMSDKLFEC